MNIISQLNMTLPIIFINPYFNQDCRLIDKVTELGGVGVIDHVTAGPALFASDTSIFAWDKGPSQRSDTCRKGVWDKTRYCSDGGLRSL